MNATDVEVFRWVNRWPQWMAAAMDFLSTATDHLWFKLVLVALVLGLCLYGPVTRRAAVQALLAFPLANWFTDLFKHHLATPRPFQVLGDAILRVGPSTSAGTASAHAANMAAVAFVFAYHLGAKWGVPWFLIAFLVGVSRVYNGAHYPLQVLLGWICGIVAATIVTKTWELVRAKRADVSIDGPHEQDDRQENLGIQ